MTRTIARRFLVIFSIQTVRESLMDVAPKTVIRFGESRDFSIILDLFLALGESKGISINSKFELPDRLPIVKDPFPPVVGGLVGLSDRLIALLSTQTSDSQLNAIRVSNLEYVKAVSSKHQHRSQ